MLIAINKIYHPGNRTAAESTIKELMPAIQLGTEIPPIVCNNFRLVDGLARLEAYKRLGYKEVEVRFI